MNFHFIAIEGAIGVGKSSLAQLLAERLEATTVLEEWGQNSFLKPFYDGKPGVPFQVEVFYLLSRYRQQQELLQRNLFQLQTISDYVFGFRDADFICQYAAGAVVHAVPALWPVGICALDL